MTDPYNPKQGEYLTHHGWRGFLIESKSYMGYGASMARWRFWLRYPLAWLSYWRSCRADG